MDPTAEPLTMYGQPSEVASLDWSWVDEQLTAASVYWITTADDHEPNSPGASPHPHPRPGGASRHPHPRPVWGVWMEGLLYLSIGSPRINAALAEPTPVTVHLGGDIDVVILEGTSAGPSDTPKAIERYNAKYDWNYLIEDYGPFTLVTPSKVIAWRSAGWAGRDGFQSTGRWRFPPPEA